MNFLNSAFLAGLTAALIPLLIHLLNRRRLKTVEFSSVMFLRDLRKTRMRRLQLRRWLLLLIRTLLVAMAVLAFARPALKGGVFASLGSRARTTAVLAIDRSASMALETQNGTAYERALARLPEIAALWGDGDEAIALPFSSPAPAQADPPSADLAAVSERFGDLPVSAGATDGSGALQTALAALSDAANLNREIYFFSDLQREGLIRTTVPAPNEDGPDDVTIYVLDVAERGGFDLGVTSVALANQLIEPGSPFAVSATVANHTDRPVDRLLVSLFIDGRRIGQRETNVGARGTATVDFLATADAAGVHAGFIEISSDDNALNNRRYFTVAIPEEIKVLLASDYASGRTAAALALSPRPSDPTRITTEQVDSDQLIRQNFFDYDCVIIAEWRVPNREVAEHLFRYVRAGGGVFVAPSFDADTTAWNTILATPHYGLRLGPPPAPPDPDRYFVWERYDWNHPIWSVYGGVDQERIPEIRWHAIFRTEGTHTGQAVVSFSGGRPALSETRLESGKLIALWSPLAPSYTNLPLRSVFVPFMHRLVEYLSADLSERRSDFAVGEPVLREPARSIASDAVLEVVAPDGSRLRPGLERDGNRVRVTLDGVDEPGVYTIVIPGQENTPIDAFSVNVDPAEMNPDVISREELKRRWDGYNLVFVGSDQPLDEVVNQTRYGTELRPAFLWIVAILFFAEMLVARTRRRDMPLHGTVSAEAAPSAAPSN